MRYYGVQNEVKSYLNRLQSEEGIEVSLGTVKTLNDRVEALKKSGVWSQYGLGFNDGDADRYFQRATVRDAIGRFEVCLFVRGMKTLGLWQNMVSWPMRSYQNAGTGSTVYSLGGLGVYDGSMVNSPTWGANGVNFIPSSYINAVNYPNYPYTGEGGFGLSIFSVVNPLGWLPNSTSRNLALLGGWDYRPVLTLTTGVGGGDTMALQKSVVAYNYTPLGGSYINNYMRIYVSPSINTTYYKNSFLVLVPDYEMVHLTRYLDNEGKLFSNSFFLNC